MKINICISGILCLISLWCLSACNDRKTTVVDKGRIEIQSLPEKAVISILGKEIETPVKAKIRPGIYLIKAGKPGYKDTWLKLEINAGKTEHIHFRLRPETADVLISSEPAGAAVVFQGKKLGLTPVIIRDLPCRSYSAEIIRTGYSPRTVSWKIDSAVPKRVNVKLMDNTGTLKINAKIRDAEVFLNGKPAGSLPFDEKLEAGKYYLEIRKNGYNPFAKYITIGLQQITRIDSVHLIAQDGSIKIISSPSGATIFVNGKSYGNTPATISHLKPGTYSIRLEKTGFDPVERKIELMPGNNMLCSLKLDGNTGGVDLVTQPAGVSVYLDGKKIGVTQIDPNQRFVSKVMEIRSLPLGRHTIRIYHKYGRPKRERSCSFTIRKGEIVRLPNQILWVPNARLTFQNGKSQEGRLVQTLKKEYLFEPEKGVKQEIDKDSVINVEMLNVGE